MIIWTESVNVQWASSATHYHHYQTATRWAGTDSELDNSGPETTKWVMTPMPGTSII